MGKTSRLHPGRHAPRPTFDGAPARLLLRLAPDVAQALTRAALAAGVSVSEWVRLAIAERLERHRGG